MRLPILATTLPSRKRDPAKQNKNSTIRFVGNVDWGGFWRACIVRSSVLTLGGISNTLGTQAIARPLRDLNGLDV